MDRHDHPTGVSQDRVLPEVWKPGFLIPDDAASLPPHLSKSLEILLRLRRQEGDAVGISPSNSTIASLYGCCPGHVKRLLADLVVAYPGVTIEKASRNVRVIRFDFHISPPHGMASVHPSGNIGAPPKAMVARKRSTQSVHKCELGGAPGAPPSEAPVLYSLNTTNTTLRNGLELPQIQEQAFAPVHNATPPPIESKPAEIETAEARDARLKAHLESLPAAERKALEDAVIKRSPSLRGRVAILAALVLAELDQSHPDLYPPLAPASIAQPRAAVESAMSTVEKIQRLASPTGPEAVDAVVKAVVHDLGDFHSVAWHRQLWTSAAAGTYDANTLAKLFTTAKRAAMPARNFGKAVKGLKDLSEKTAGQVIRQDPLPSGPKTIPALTTSIR